MTPPKNGNRRLIIIIATIIILPLFGWVFNEVVWGGIQENKSSISENKTVISNVDTNITRQLYDFRVMLMRIEVRQQADSSAIRRIERKLGI